MSVLMTCYDYMLFCVSVLHKTQERESNVAKNDTSVHTSRYGNDHRAKAEEATQ